MQEGECTKGHVTGNQIENHRVENYTGVGRDEEEKINNNLYANN